jgi:hypothetical protein
MATGMPERAPHLLPRVQPDTAPTDDAVGGPAPIRFGAGPVPPIGPAPAPRAGGVYASPSDAAYGPITDEPSPFTCDVSEVELAGAKDHRTVTITNTSENAVILDVDVTGDPVFTFDGMLSGQALAPGASLDIGVGYASHLEGAYQGELVVGTTDLVFPKPPLRIPITGTAVARKTVGTAIAAKSPGGKANTIDSAVSSLGDAWEQLLKEQLAGVELVQGYAQDSQAASPSPLWAELLQAALMIGVIGVTRGLAKQITNELRTLIFADVRNQIGGDKADAYVVGEMVAGVTERVHGAMHGQVVDTLQSAIAGSIKSGILQAKTGGAGKTGGSGKAAIARDAFFESMKSELNAGVTSIKTAANNTTGDYQALEDEQEGLGFTALEGYRNEIATIAQTAKAAQIHKTLGLYSAYLAQARTGTTGSGQSSDTDLDGSGGLATDESKLGERGRFADGVLVLDMAWGNLSIKSARVRGLNENLRALLSTAPLGSFPLPIVLAGNVLGTAGETPRRGEVRVGRTEQGSLYAIAAETEDDVESGKAPGWAFLGRAARNDFSERTTESGRGRVLDLDEAEQAAANIFARLDDVTLSSVGDG